MGHAFRLQFLGHAEIGHADADGSDHRPGVVPYGRGDPSHLRMILGACHRISGNRDQLQHRAYPLGISDGL